MVNKNDGSKRDKPDWEEGMLARLAPKSKLDRWVLVGCTIGLTGIVVAYHLMI